MFGQICGYKKCILNYIIYSSTNFTFLKSFIIKYQYLFQLYFRNLISSVEKNQNCANYYLVRFLIEDISLFVKDKVSSKAG